ncbi:MAG: hypothetical protein ACTSQJ_07025 [Promethearchaeota archaeon]
MGDNSNLNTNKEDLKEKVEKANKNLKIWTMLFFGLTLQTIQMWSWFFNPHLDEPMRIWNYGVFIFIGIWFLIGFLAYKIYNLQIKSVEKTHDHKFDKSFHCEICGKYWDLRTCLFCNSKNIIYVKREEDFEYFKRFINVIQCKSCGKMIEIDSFSSLDIRGVKSK